jgi:hypothetical protein
MHRLNFHPPTAKNSTSHPRFPIIQYENLVLDKIPAFLLAALQCQFRVRADPKFRSRT